MRSGTIDADIMVMNADGSTQAALTGPSQLEWAPAWSHDGSKIAYSVAVAGCAIALMNADGTNQTVLGSSPASLIAVGRRSPFRESRSPSGASHRRH